MKALLNHADSKHYQDIVSRLIMTTSYPDMFYMVRKFSQYSVNPAMYHLIKSKPVLCYLKGTKTCYLVFNKSSFDADWKNSKDHHSITGYYFQLLPI